MSEIINGVPIGDLPGIESVPDDSMLVVEFLGKAYHMPGAVLRQMIQDVLDSMGDSVDDVTEARLTAAIETVLASGKYNGVSPLVEVLDEEDGTSVIHIIDAFGVKKYPVEVKGARNAVQYVEQELTDEQKAQARKNIGVGDGTGTADAVQYVPQTLTTEQQTQARNNIGISGYVSFIGIVVNPNLDLTSQHIDLQWYINGWDGDSAHFEFDVPYSAYELARRNGYTKDEVTFYKEMSSNLGNPKADSLQINSDTGTLMLLSANEPIGDGVTIPVFVGKYDTVTFTEIKTAHDAGRVCFLDFKGIPFLLLGVDDTEALFVREMNENQDYEVTITANGEKSFKILDKNISNVYVSGLFSAKYAEVKAAYEAGKACFVTYGALLCPLTVLDEKKAEFVGMLTPHIGMRGILYADGTYDFQNVRSNAVQTVGQSLTDDQKAQARTNIGALSTDDVDTVLQQAKDSGQFDGEDGANGQRGTGTLVIYSTPTAYTEQVNGLTPAYRSTRALVIDHSGIDPIVGDVIQRSYYHYPVIYVDDTYVYMSNRFSIRGAVGETGKTAYAYAQDGGYTGTEAEFAAKLASGSEPLVVTLSGNDTDGYTADKTVAEIYAARNAGRDVYMVGGVVTYQLSYLSSSFAAFSYTMASRSAIEIISVIMMSGVAPTRIHQTIDDSYVKYTAQSLDEEYKLQARTNIGAAAAADIAQTASLGISNSAAVYVKISDFGPWGTGAWYQKGFAMLITSRAGEMVWVAISSDDSNTNAKAIRLLNTYSKIAAIYYSASESAVYVKANAWCNNINAHIISNINGDYVPTVAQASALPSDAVQITITEFGAGSGKTSIGDTSRALGMTGSATRPTYNGADMALSSDLSSYVTTDTAQTITGVKTFNAPANVAGTEQHTAKFKTSNGGAIIFGKEAANSGTMLRFDQADGTCRLRFRASATAGAMVWEQPEQGAQLYIDLGKEGVDKKRITFPSSAGTLALTSQIPSLSGYLPLSGGLMTGSLKFQAASLPGKSLQYICGVDAFASGGEMGWQSKADFLSGYATTGGNVNTSTMPLGFAGRVTGATWGNTIGTSFTSWNDPTGGSIDFRQDNPSSGKMSIKVDGRVYVNEGLNPVMGTELANSFWGMTSPDGENNVWIRTTTQGIIPYQSGGAGAGHCSLGTSSWYFANAYIDKVYGSNFSGLAAKATADANGNNIASTYASKNVANTFNGEQKMVNSTHCPTMNDIASGVGCSLKNARACDNQLIVAEIFAPTAAATDSTINMNAVIGEIGFYHGGSGSGGQFTGKTQLARITSAGIYEGSTLLANKYVGKSSSGGVYVSGRYAGGGDDEGIVIGRASNNYAGLTLGDRTGIRSVFYLLPDNSAVWRYNDGSASYDIKHPGKAGTIALLSDVVEAANGALKVTLSGNATDGYTVDKTYAEIQAVWNAGRYVYVTNGAVVYNPSLVNANLGFIFTYTRATGDGVEVWSVLVNNLGTRPTVVEKTITA